MGLSILNIVIAAVCVILLLGNQCSSYVLENENTSHQQVSSEMQMMLELINMERKKLSLSKLCFNAKLNEAALDHSLAMKENEFFSHAGTDGLDFWDRIVQTGYKAMLGAENLATDVSIENAHQGLMDSKGHRENILLPNIQHVGIGITKYNGSSKYRFHGNFVITQVFGSSYGEDECMSIEHDPVTASKLINNTNSPTQEESNYCNDSTLYFRVNGNMYDCRWVQMNTSKRCRRKGISSHCPKTCSTCSKCVDSAFKFKLNDSVKKKMTCRWVSKDPTSRCTRPAIAETCKKSCGLCNE
jgi:uncharacterized protein YkwD